MRVGRYNGMDQALSSGSDEKRFEMRCALKVLNLLMKFMFVVRNKKESRVSLGMWIFAAGLG